MSPGSPAWRPPPRQSPRPPPHYPPSPPRPRRPPAPWPPPWPRSAQPLPRLPRRRAAAHRNPLAARAPALSSADPPVGAEGDLLLQPPESAGASGLSIERAELVPALLPRASLARRAENGP